MENVIEFIDHPSVMTSGPLTLAPGRRPKRVVLRKLDREFVTHVEYMVITSSIEKRENVNIVIVRCAHRDWDLGHYFTFGGPTGRSEADALKEATADFQERLQS